MSLLADNFRGVIGSVTCSELDLSSRRSRRGDGRRHAPVDAVVLGHEVVLVPAASAVVEQPAVLLVGIVVPSLSVIVTITRERGQEAGVLLCARAKLQIIFLTMLLGRGANLVCRSIWLT